MSELLEKQVNAQKESLKNTSGACTSSCKSTKKCAMKIKQRKKDVCIKNLMLLMDRRREFIEHAWETHAMDINKLQVDDC